MPNHKKNIAHPSGNIAPPSENFWHHQFDAWLCFSCLIHNAGPCDDGNTVHWDDDNTGEKMSKCDPDASTSQGIYTCRWNEQYLLSMLHTNDERQLDESIFLLFVKMLFIHGAVITRTLLVHLSWTVIIATWINHKKHKLRTSCTAIRQMHNFNILSNNSIITIFTSFYIAFILYLQNRKTEAVLNMFFRIKPKSTVKYFDLSLSKNFSQRNLVKDLIKRVWYFMTLEKL